jgi:hypothetical protein
VFDREEWDVADGDGADAGELFEERAIADVDADRVWESILDDESSTDEPGGPCPGTDAGPERTDARERSHTVPKREYCQSCVFFSEPPAVACTHDAGTIVEVVDSERFVVRGCPVVAGRVDTDGTVLAWDGPAGDGRVPSVAERTDRPGTDEQ